SNLVTFTYSAKEVLLFKAYRAEKPELYDNSYYKRALSHNEIVPRDEEFDFFKFFENESSLGQKI
ncbi:hypothetical protein, partial [Vibrio cholerae]